MKPAAGERTYLCEVLTDTKSRESGIEAEIHVFHLITIRDDKLATLRVFMERAEALAAAGITDA